MQELSRPKKVFFHAVLTVAAIISILPLYRIITVALRPGDKIFSTNFEMFPATPTFENFTAVFTQTEFILWLANSLFVTILTALISVILSATAAYALSRYRFPMRTGVFMFLM